jgi:hypothetical protein
VTEAAWPVAERRSQWWLLAAGIAGLALAASFNGIWNDFTYDDLFIIVSNDIVHDLKRAWGLFFLPYWPIRLGGDGYRPLTLLAFAVQWGIAPTSAMFFHAISIALYVGSAVAVFWLTSLLLPTAYAWLAAAFFAVHPVHVEAVANVVGQSELWTGLLVVSACALYIQWRRADTFGPRQQVLLTFVYLAACLFKEHAVVLPLLFLVAEALVIDELEPLASRLRRLRPFLLGQLLVACAYIVFRNMVIHKELGGFAPFIPFVSLHIGYVDRVLTMLGVVPHWLRLLLWPAALTSEYGPPEYPIAQGLALWQFPGLLILVGVVGLAFATMRRAPVIAFGILWLTVTLLPSSNFILPSGILLAERTLFTPSFGAMLACCAALPYVAKHLKSPGSRTAALAAAQSLLFAGAAKSTIQTAVWRSNDSLFSAAVRASPSVYRSHYMLGAWMMAKKKFPPGERQYLAAIALFPHDPFVAYNLGQEYFHAGMYDRAYPMYARAASIMPKFEDAEARMALTRAMEGRYPEAAALATQAIQNGVGDLKVLRAILTAASLDELSRRKLVARIAKQPARVIAR